MFGKKKPGATPSPVANVPPAPAPQQPAPSKQVEPPKPAAAQPNGATYGAAQPQQAAAPAAPAPQAPPTTASQPTAPQPVTPSPEPQSQSKPLTGPEKSSAITDSVKMASFTDTKLESTDYQRAKKVLIENLLEQVDFRELEVLSTEAKKTRISETADSLVKEISIPLTAAQHNLLKKSLLDEVLGFGPLEPILADPDVSDIMINTHKQVYIEKSGKLYITDITFTSEKHLQNIIQKIVSLVGRRVDETSPMVDARMPDGSRFNAIIPPLALDGSLVSIRKFKQNKMPLSQYIDYNSMSQEMVTFLEVCSNIRLNILVSGGTGSGKTTLLNALSGHIDPGERVITIEDAAELQLHQPHVLRLETRPPNIEGAGEINQRQLVKNALRMRPDRIILGEIRGDEVIDVLQAMNTGHDGSMATIHANNPRDCLNRVENLFGMAGMNLPLQALRAQVASAINMIVQISRMRDGGRRITKIEEIVGMETDIITTQTLFQFNAGPLDDNGKITGTFKCTGIKPRFMDRAAYFGRERELKELFAPR